MKKKKFEQNTLGWKSSGFARKQTKSICVVKLEKPCGMLSTARMHRK